MHFRFEEFIMAGENAMDFAIWCLIEKTKQERLFSMSISSSCTSNYMIEPCQGNKTRTECWRFRRIQT